MTKSPVPASNTLPWILWIGIGLLPLMQWPEALDAGLNARQLGLGLLVMTMVTIGFVQHRKILGQQKLFWVLAIALTWWLWGWVGHIGALSKADSLALGLRNGSLIGLLMITLIGLRSGLLAKSDVIRAGFYFGLVTGGHALLEIVKAIADGRFQEDVYAITGLFQHKNLLSGALLVSMPFALMTILEGKAWERKAAAALGILLLLELFMLRTRGAWLGILSAALLLIPLAWWMGAASRIALKRALRWWPALLIALAALGYSISRETAGSQLLNERNITHRFAFWKNTVEMFQEHPVTGVGNGNWRIYFSKYGLAHTDAKVMNGETRIQRPHNDYLWILSEQGLPGLLLFLALLGWSKWHLWRNKAREDEASAARQLALWFGFIALTVFALGDFPYERSGIMALFILLLALMNAEGDDPSTISWPVLSTLLVLGGVALGSSKVAQERIKAEVASRKVQEYNSNQDRRIIQAAHNAENDFYQIDNFNNPLPYYAALGEMFLTRDLRAAKADLNRSLELHPWHFLSMNQYGNLLKMENQWSEAEAYFDQALAISPAFELARLNKAEALAQRQEWEEAFIWMHGCALNTKNQKLYQLAAQILPNWLKEKSNKPQNLQPPLAKRLMAFQNNPQQLVQEYARYRQEVFKRDQRARSAGKKS